MKLSELIIYTAAVVTASLFASCGPKQSPAGNEYLVAAYIWPSCHDDSLAHEYLWEEGMGEWQVINKGNPRFEGHYQPKQPLWGYEMDDDPVVVEKWINTALEHGVNTFVYDWYWYKGYPYLEGALNDGFLKAPSHDKMNFYIMWANHDVKYNYWNYHRYGDREDLLFTGDVDWENYKIIVDRIIKQYFCQPNYVKFDGKPLMTIFSMPNLIHSFGNLNGAAAAIQYFRDEAKKAGYPDIYFMPVYGGAPRCEGDFKKHFMRMAKALKVDGVSFYNMGGFDNDYQKYCDNSVEIRETWQDLGFPAYACVSVGWDDTPRFPAYGQKDVCYMNTTPEVFQACLEQAKAYADSHPEQPKLITINAWNEWVEGSYLLPDKVNGFGYLDAVKNVFCK